VGAADALKGQVPVGLLVLTNDAAEARAPEAGRPTGALLIARRTRHVLLLLAAPRCSQAGVDPVDVVRDVVGDVRARIGAVASFRAAAVVEALPKTRSGKTLRGIIQHLADGTGYTLPGTIEDASAVELAREALRTIDYPRPREQ
jgi:Acyl-coenzyme A synthetases/AMP-(fatty) acid ligases